jgi:hypothetical protein
LESLEIARQLQTEYERLRGTDNRTDKELQIAMRDKFIELVHDKVVTQNIDGDSDASRVKRNSILKGNDEGDIINSHQNGAQEGGHVTEEKKANKNGLVVRTPSLLSEKTRKNMALSDKRRLTRKVFALKCCH